MIQVNLTNNNGYKWHHVGGVWSKGFAFLPNGELLRDSEFVKWIHDNLDFDNALTLVGSLDGQFSIVVANNNACIGIVDRTLSMPLFYRQSDEDLIIRDQLSLSDMKEYGIDENQLAFYSHSMYTLESETFVLGFHVLIAGTAFFFRKNNFFLKQYYSFDSGNSKISNFDEAIAEIDACNERTCKKLSKLLDGRQAVVSLSGGHDSRFIAFFLKKIGCKNVITYSYGLKDTPDAVIAKALAQEMDFPFYFIDCERHDLRKAFDRHKEEFWAFASNGMTLPGNEAGLMSIYSLWKQGLIDEHSMVLNGNSGDLLCGDRVLSLQESKEPIGDLVINQHFHEVNFINQPDFYISNLKNDAGYLFQNEVSFLEKNALTERFNFENRQCKYIMPSGIKAYEFWGNGFEYAMPLFWKGWLDSWLCLDVSLRYGREFLLEYEKRFYPKNISQIPFADSVQDGLFKKYGEMIKKGASYFHYIFSFYHPHKLFFNFVIERFLLHRNVGDINGFKNRYIVKWLKSECEV